MKKVFFFDIDGTLLPLGQDRPTERTKHAITELQNRGHEVFIATGKSIEHAKWLGDAVGVNNYIATNGQVMMKDGELLYENGFSLEDVKKWTEIAQKNDMIIGYQGAFESGMLNGNTELITKAQLFFDDVTIEHPRLIENYPENYKVGQMWFVGDLSEINYDDEKYHVVSWPHTGYDVLPKGMSKAHGINFYIENSDETIQTYAFGDGHNDVEMFEYVDNAIAMDNASERVKSFASEITLSADDDGIYDYLLKADLIGAYHE